MIHNLMTAITLFLILAAAWILQAVTGETLDL